MKYILLFSHELKPALFIHIPKTGGNTIQKHLFDKGLSLDKMKLSSHQDGEDRFDVVGKYTSHKHMKLSEYYKYNELRNIAVFTCIRHPLSRMVSLYLSPHRHLRLETISQQWVMPPTIEFNIDDFKSVVTNSPSMINILSYSTEINNQAKKCIPSNLKILRTESLNKDSKRHLNLEIKSSKNVSPYKEMADTLKSDEQIISIIKKSHHQYDIDLFYGEK